MTTPSDFTPEELKRRIDSVVKRAEAAARRKAQLQGTLKAREEELAVLLKEIRDAGYKPKELVTERDRVQGELIAMLEQYEADMTKVEEALSSFDKEKVDP